MSIPTNGDDLIVGFPLPGSSTSIIDGLAGYDVIDFSAATARLTGSLGRITVFGIGSRTLRNVEALIGSDFDDSVTGNVLANSLSGGLGNDLLRGGDGSDTLIGGVGNDTLFGDAGSDLLQGDIGDDSLNGGAGVDTLTGGVGDDSYQVDDASDVITELLDEGNDSVTALVTYTLSDNVETLLLSGVTGIDGYGNGLANLLQGNGGNNFLFGFDGNDTLRGLAGNDSLDGDLGNDSLDGGIADDYLFGGLGNGADTLIGGSENDSLDGGAGDDSLFGDGPGASSLTGNDLLLGGTGNDTLDGGRGDDILFGEAGSDVFVYRPQGGADRINDFEIGVDTIRIENLTVNGVRLTSFSQLQPFFVQDGADAGIVFALGQKIVLQGIDATNLTAADFVFA